MNPRYLWLTEGLELITFFIGIPIIAFAIAYAAWRGKSQNFIFRRSRTIGLASVAVGFLLFLFAKWLGADPRSVEYFAYLACVLTSLLLFGVFMGCGFCEMLRLWQWHRRTALKSSP